MVKPLQIYKGPPCLKILCPADRAIVESFCRELALALRRILEAGNELPPVELPQPVPVDEMDASDAHPSHSLPHSAAVGLQPE